MMKIVKIGNNCPGEEVGGMEVLTDTMSTLLHKKGFDITLLCFSRKREKITGRHYPLIKVHCPIKIFKMPVPLSSHIFKLVSNIKNADVVHIYYPSPIGTFLSTLIAKILNKPTVLSIESNIGIDVSSENRGILYKPLAFINNIFFLRYSIKNVDRVIVPSPSFLKHSKYTRRFSNSAILVQNGVDTSMFHPNIDGEWVRVKHGIGSSKMILFLGSLNATHRGKGLPVLMEGVKILKENHTDLDSKLVIAADGDMEQEYRKMAAELGIEEDTIFATGVPRAEVPAYYSAADVFVLPSVWYEAFGLVLVEAMACGTPVIGSDMGGIPYVIGDAGIITPAGDAAALADSLYKVLSNEGYAKTMSKKGLERVRSNFTWDITIDKTIKIYKDLFNKKVEG